MMPLVSSIFVKNLDNLRKFRKLRETTKETSFTKIGFVILDKERSVSEYKDVYFPELECFSRFAGS